ncbi:TrmB family transcriptional regulator [Thermococcus zilligii]|uniref:TrmB family transcriptional regulator n=1 Tax=Thermococcus zilligii TaxID=54076 RepID=UPI00029AD020|nr:TrmB family transcriptional regulator sugar-binding domain-containing protein [Thermococcus zilligii]
MESLLEQLKKFGFTKYEALAYITLLTYGPLTARGISQKGQIPYNRTYDVLTSLKERGFVEELESKARTFVAVEPEVAFHRYSRSLKELIDDIKKFAESMSVKEQKHAIWRFSSPEEVLLSLETMMKKAKFEFTLLAPKSFLPKVEDGLRGLLEKGVTVSIYTNEEPGLAAEGNVFIRLTDKIGHIIAMRDTAEVLVSPSLVFNVEEELPSGFKSNFPEIIFSHYIYLRDIFEESKPVSFALNGNGEIRFAVFYHAIQAIERLFAERVELDAEVHTTSGEVFRGRITDFTNTKIINNILLDTGERKILVGGPFSILEEYEEMGIVLYLKRTYLNEESRG